MGKAIGCPLASYKTKYEQYEPNIINIHHMTKNKKKEAKMKGIFTLHIHVINYSLEEYRYIFALFMKNKWSWYVLEVF